MRKKYRSLITLCGITALLPLQSAAAYDIARPELLKLAREFVDRIGQKIQSSPDEERAFSYIPDGEILIFQPRIGNKVVIEGTFAVIRKNKTSYFSFRELCEVLNFPLRVDTEKGSAKGWFIKEVNIFSMDLRQGIVRSLGREFRVEKNEWFQQDGEIYVSANSIYRWMGIESQLNPEMLLVDLVSDEPFPLEDRIARRKRKLDGATVPKEPFLPRAENPYQMARVPAADVTLGVSMNKPYHETASSRIAQSISTVGDMFGLTTRSLTAMNRDHGIESFRFTAGKKSDKPDLLGSLHAREFGVGDIIPTELSGTGLSEEEFGVRVTNTDDGQLTASTTRTFEGDVPPDWDVELYDGNQLIGFQTVGTDGRYRFAGIDLFTGDNDFRIVFYGPQGEVREEEVSIPISLEDVGREGRLYDVSLSLNGIQSYNHTPLEDPDKGTPHLVVSYEQGIREGLTLGTGVNIKQANEKIKTLAKGSAAMRLGKTLLNTELVTDEELEISFRATARRTFGEHSLIATSYFATSNFDPDNTQSPPIIYRNDFSARGPLATIFNREVTYNFTGSYTENANDNNHISAAFSQNMKLGRYTLGHALDFDRNYTGGEQSQDVLSVFSARTSLGKTRLRASAGYRYFPDREWDSITFNINRYLLKDLQGEIEVKHQIAPDSTEATAQLNWRNERFTLSPRVTYDSNHDLRASVNMRFGLLYDEFDKSLTMTRDTLTHKGAVHAFVYLDKDGNRKFDKGQDEPIEGAKVMTVQFSRYKLTDKDGVAFLSDLPEYEATDVILDQASLGDPYYVAGFEGLSTLPRPGAPIKIEFPIHVSGEMDGTVFKPGRKGFEAASGIRPQLYNSRGEPVMSSLTAFDGYYVISTIPPGDYLLMINHEDLKGTGYRQPWPKKVTVGYDGKVIAGQDIYLTYGDEVPVQFFKTPKESKENAGPASAAGIEIQMGAYRSGLLAQVVKLRIARALHQAGLAFLPLNFRDIKLDKRPAHEIFAPLPATAMQEARDICEALAAQKLSCAITLPPSLLLENSRKEAQSKSALPSG